MNLRNAAIRATLEGLHFSGAARLLGPLSSGIGTIFTLHHVRPERPEAFQPNALLEVEPAFLETLIEYLRYRKVNLVSLAEVRRRLREQDYSNRFVAFTLDDGYRDNLEFAWPIFRKHDVPATLFIASNFPEGQGFLWWTLLERVVASSDRVEIEMQKGVTRVFDCASPEAKQKVYDEIYGWLRGLADETALRQAVTSLCERYNVDPLGPCKELCMNWDELKTLRAEPLISIGAHTVTHPMLKKCDVDTVKNELVQSRVAIGQALGTMPVDFAYPVGDKTSADAREFSLAKEAGYELAVTTRPGVIFPEHREHMTALPRVSLNGYYQKIRYAEVLRSGVPFALRSCFGRLDVA